MLVGVSGGAGNNELISVCSTELGAGAVEAATGASLSSDGRMVFFTAQRCPTVGAHAEVPSNQVWVRVDESESVWLSESECGSGVLPGEVSCREAGPADAAFQGVSADGSKAFFTSTQQLTNNASEDRNSTDTAEGEGCSRALGPNGCNLYEYDFGNAARQRLVTVSAGDTSGDGPQVQGVMAISSDGSHVYFVAKGVLSTAANARGQTAVDGAENLYVFERDAAHPTGQVRFITAMSSSEADHRAADSREWDKGARLANVSSDGRFLVFTSQAPLTADDTRADGGAGQVFRYDAATGALVRVSIGDGGFNDNGNTGLGNAYIVPGSVMLKFAGGSGRRDPTMSDDGLRVFFMSPIALTPKALNDVPTFEEEDEVSYAENVYEYENGHVYLLSDGRDVGGQRVAACGSAFAFSSVCLIGTDVSGDNVFFSTADQLVSADTDTQLDFYDARVCTAGSPCVQSAPAALPPCFGEACRGVPARLRESESPPSESFSGAGNESSPRVARSPGRAQRLRVALRACHRLKARHRRHACERAARRRYRRHL
jgi:hypothetical protein